MRIGIGHDTHRTGALRPLILGGLRIDHPKGLHGHSDADVVLHALTDALLGAAGLGDIGDAYPDTDLRYKDTESSKFVRETLARVNQKGYRLVNVDVTIFAEAPKLGKAVKDQMRNQIASILGIAADAVNVKAKTGEKVGSIGRCEAIGCEVAVLIDK
jgi:2-C-methyl-D-erythritol 2,4-cyclodiphosphate synthase